jgi:hypothetical protein
MKVEDLYDHFELVKKQNVGHNTIEDYRQRFMSGASWVPFKEYCTRLVNPDYVSIQYLLHT